MGEVFKDDTIDKEFKESVKELVDQTIDDIKSGKKLKEKDKIELDTTALKVGELTDEEKKQLASDEEKIKLLEQEMNDKAPDVYVGEITYLNPTNIHDLQCFVSVLFENFDKFCGLFMVDKSILEDLKEKTDRDGKSYSADHVLYRTVKLRHLDPQETEAYMRYYDEGVPTNEKEERRNGLATTSFMNHKDSDCRIYTDTWILE